MLIESPEALRAWLTSTLEPICDADPGALAKYVMALLKKDRSEPELKEFCVEQLDVFLQKETKSFVDCLFQAITGKTYLPGTSNGSAVPGGGSNDTSTAATANHHATEASGAKDEKSSDSTTKDSLAAATGASSSSSAAPGGGGSKQKSKESSAPAEKKSKGIEFRFLNKLRELINVIAIIQNENNCLSLSSRRIMSC